MRIILTKSASREANKCGFSDRDISVAMSRANAGLLDNKIGHLLIKQEVGRAGEGRKTAGRAIVAFNFGESSIVLHVFEKSRKKNISEADRKVFEDNASSFLNLSNDALEKLIAERGWREIHDKAQEIGKGEDVQE